MRRLAICLTLGVAGLQSMTLPLSARELPQPGPSLMVCSLSMEPVLRPWVETYSASNPAFKVDLQPQVGALAVKALLEGKSQLAPLNREMTREEISAFTAKWGHAPTRLAVAMDALVMIVQKSNPIKEIKIEQLDAVFSSTRLQGWPKDISTWGELGLTGGNWANRPILRLGRPDGSGLRSFFVQAVEMGGKGKDDTKRGLDSLSMIEEITANQAALGYGGMGELFGSTRAVAIIPKGGKTAVEPRPATVMDGSYPLSIVLYIYVNKTPGMPLDANLAGFLRYVLSKEGQKQAQANGLVALPEDLIGMNLRRIAQ